MESVLNIFSHLKKRHETFINLNENENTRIKKRKRFHNTTSQFQKSADQKNEKKNI
jgi:hypothetical protein